MSAPNALIIARRPGATTNPASMPSTAPTTPTASASPVTSSRTWRRLAPSARSSANSRWRWATVIENVLKIRNAPTKVAIPAKISSIVGRNAIASLMSCACWSPWAAPVRTVPASPIAAWIRSASCVSETPESASAITSE